jgi:hypothetical protein
MTKLENKKYFSDFDSDLDITPGRIFYGESFNKDRRQTGTMTTAQTHNENTFLI